MMAKTRTLQDTEKDETLAEILDLVAFSKSNRCPTLPPSMNGARAVVAAWREARKEKPSFNG